MTSRNCEGGPGAFASVSLRFVAEPAMNVRPEFLEDDCQRVVGDLRAPDAGRVADGFIRVRMIAVGRDCRRCGAAQDFGKIEFPVSGVAARDENPAHRIFRSTPEPARAFREEPGVLTKERGIYGLSH